MFPGHEQTAGNHADSNLQSLVQSTSLFLPIPSPIEAPLHEIMRSSCPPQAKWNSMLTIVNDLLGSLLFCLQDFGCILRTLRVPSHRGDIVQPLPSENEYDHHEVDFKEYEPSKQRVRVPEALQVSEGRTGNLGYNSHVSDPHRQRAMNSKDSQLQLFRRTRNLRSFLLLRRPSTHRLLKITIHRIIQLALSFRQREGIKLECLALDIVGVSIGNVQ